MSYLSYHALYACGSPFETGDKPAICAGIDPIKLDLYSLYQSKFYKTNAEPYISPLIEKGNDIYLEYGIPVQSRLSELYLQYGKNRIDQGCIQAHQVYKYQVEPFYMDRVAPLIGPYLAQAKPYYNSKIEILLDQSTKKAYEARAILQYKLNNLPPAINQVKENAEEQISYWIQRAENTDLIPILEKLYWAIIDFFQFDLLPAIKYSHVATEMNSYYNANMKQYVDLNIKPVLAPLQLAKLLHFIHAYLPTRPEPIAEQVFAATTASTQIKTASIIVPKTKDIPITPPAASAKTVTITSKKQSAPAFATTTQQKPEATIGKYVSNNEDIIHETSVKPTTETVHAPDTDKKEAIYVPTCNSAEEQLIIANTDKNVQTVRTDKHLVAVPSDKDLFEVHKKDMDIPAQPTSANNEEVENQYVIQAPIQHTEKESPTIAEEDIVLSIQTEVPTASEEEIVFRIQTEVPTVSEEDVVSSIESEVPTAAEQDIVFSIQTEVPTAAEQDIVFNIQTEEETIASIQTEAPTATEEDIIFSIQTEATVVKQDIVEDKLEESIKEEIVEEIKDVKEDNIFVPPAIQKEELVLESRKDHDDKEPIFVKIEEPVQEEQVDYQEPIVKVEEVEEPIVKVKVPIVKVEEPVNEPLIKVKAPLAKEQIETIVTVQE